MINYDKLLFFYKIYTKQWAGMRGRVVLELSLASWEQRTSFGAGRGVRLAILPLFKEVGTLSMVKILTTTKIVKISGLIVRKKLNSMVCLKRYLTELINLLKFFESTGYDFSLHFFFSLHYILWKINLFITN